MLLYISSQAVIPAPYQVRDKLQRLPAACPCPMAGGRGMEIQTSSLRKQGTSIYYTGFPRIKYGAGLVKPGMTIK
jgi:hypothetical protein